MSNNYGNLAMQIGINDADGGAAAGYSMSNPVQQAVTQNTAAPAASPAVTTATPSYVTSPTVNAQGVTGSNAAGGQQIDASQYGASAMTNEIMNALNPTFAQQQLGLTDNLANAGIVGGSTTGAVGDLANTQLTQALAQLVPAQESANTNQLGAQEYNSTNQQSNNQYNATNDLNSQEYNANAANTANTNNASNALTAGTTNSSAYNTLLNSILGNQNTDYLAQLQDQYGLATGAATGQTSAYTPIYQQSSGSPLATIAEAAAASGA